MALKSHKLGSDEVRRNWRDVLDEVQLGSSVKVMRSGKTIAVIIPIELWDKAVATKTLKSDTAFDRD